MFTRGNWWSGVGCGRGGGGGDGDCREWAGVAGAQSVHANIYATQVSVLLGRRDYQERKLMFILGAGVAGE